MRLFGEQRSSYGDQKRPISLPSFSRVVWRQLVDYGQRFSDAARCRCYSKSATVRGISRSKYEHRKNEKSKSKKNEKNFDFVCLLQKVKSKQTEEKKKAEKRKIKYEQLLQQRQDEFQYGNRLVGDTPTSVQYNTKI